MSSREVALYAPPSRALRADDSTSHQSYDTRVGLNHLRFASLHTHSAPNQGVRQTFLFTVSFMSWRPALGPPVIPPLNSEVSARVSLKCPCSTWSGPSPTPGAACCSLSRLHQTFLPRPRRHLPWRWACVQWTCCGWEMFRKPR